MCCLSPPPPLPFSLLHHESVDTATKGCYIQLALLYGRKKPSNSAWIDAETEARRSCALGIAKTGTRKQVVELGSTRSTPSHKSLVCASSFRGRPDPPGASKQSIDSLVGICDSTPCKLNSQNPERVDPSPSHNETRRITSTSSHTLYHDRHDLRPPITRPTWTLLRPSDARLLQQSRYLLSPLSLQVLHHHSRRSNQSHNPLLRDRPKDPRSRHPPRQVSRDTILKYSIADATPRRGDQTTCPHHDPLAETKIQKSTLRLPWKLSSAVLKEMALDHCSLPQSRLYQTLRQDRQFEERAGAHSARDFLVVPLQDRSHVLYLHPIPPVKKRK